MSAASTFAARKAQLVRRLAGRGGEMRLHKRTSSNLFRYAPRREARRGLDLDGFDHVLGADPATRTLDAEGLATFESIVEHTLPHGLVPLVTPELKHITLGGAIVGIGIESNCYRHGFVHDALIEAEVLLPDGRIVLCTAKNDHADLFRALPNSYGTLGYILRAKVRLMAAAPHVHLHTISFDDPVAFLEAMRAATGRADVDFIEGLFYGRERLFLILARFEERVPRTDDILRHNIFYKLVTREPDVYLTTHDYLFRYDPEWFWNLPEGWPYRLFRRYAPAGLRNSGFYKRYTGIRNQLRSALPLRPGEDEEPLIQDWEVPWDQAAELMRFALSEVDLAGKPWVATPIRTPASPTLYPVRAGVLYFNLGCYCQVKKRPGEGDYHYTRIMDRKCFELGGIKMLYSSTFLDEPEFDRIYNGAAYREIKKKYDPHGALRTLYDKCVLHR